MRKSQERVVDEKSVLYMAMKNTVKQMLKDFYPLMDQEAQRHMRRLIIAAARDSSEGCPDYPPDWPEDNEQCEQEFPEHWAIVAQKIN